MVNEVGSCNFVIQLMLSSFYCCMEGAMPLHVHAVEVELSVLLYLWWYSLIGHHELHVTAHQWYVLCVLC